MYNIPITRDHDTMVKDLVTLLVNRGFTSIYADIEGFQKPALIFWQSTKDGHIPDVTAYMANGVHVIFEVETDDTINIEHSISQYKLFSAYANQHNAIFYLVVPIGYENIAQQTLQSINITAEVIGL